MNQHSLFSYAYIPTKNSNKYCRTTEIRISSVFDKGQVTICMSKFIELGDDIPELLLT